MLDLLKPYFFKAVESTTKAMGKLHMPWTQLILKDYQIRQVINTVEPGDVLVVKSGGNFGSYLLGEYSHVVFVLNQDTILDARFAGVGKQDILSVLVGYTRAVILRPKFSAIEKKNAMNRALRILEVDSTEPIEYNYSMVNGNQIHKSKVPKSFTCTQLLRDIINHGREKFMELRPRFGFMAVSPEDYVLAKSKFDNIHDSAL